MTSIGLLYDNGQGVPQDYVQAREWYEKAVAAGNAAAMTNIGRGGPYQRSREPAERAAGTSRQGSAADRKS